MRDGVAGRLEMEAPPRVRGTGYGSRKALSAPRDWGWQASGDRRQETVAGSHGAGVIGQAHDRLEALSYGRQIKSYSSGIPRNPARFSRAFSLALTGLNPSRNR